jgi:hypothetical protein
MSFERTQLVPVQISVTDDPTTSPVFNNNAASSLVIERVSGSVATLTVYTVLTVDGSGTYKPLKDRTGGVVTVTIDGTYVQEVNLAQFPCCWIRFVGDVAGVIRVGGKS